MVEESIGTQRGISAAPSGMAGRNGLGDGSIVAVGRVYASGRRIPPQFATASDLGLVGNILLRALVSMLLYLLEHVSIQNLAV